MEVPSLVGRVAILACQLGVAIGLFGAGAWALRCEELNWAWDLIRRRARRAAATP
jgi:hypothetical protein